MRSRLLVATCMVWLIASLSAYAAPEAEAGASGGGIAVSRPGEFPIVKEKVTLRMFVEQLAMVQDFDTNLMSTYMEELTNVHVEYEPAPSAALNEKRTLLLASGDLPDVFFAAKVTKSEEMTYGEQGVFIPLNDLIDRHGFEAKRMFAQEPWIRTAITTPSGRIYGLPGVSGMYHILFPQKFWVYKPWMEKLGLKMPKTTDELYEVLKAFKSRDPNGNGLQDEIPMSGAVTGGWHTRLPAYLMNAFLYFDDDTFFIMDKGKVGIPATREEYREGLRYVKKLYDEGLLDPAAFVQNVSQLRALGENPAVVLLGSCPAGWFGQFVQHGAESGRYKDYEPVPPIAGPAGYRTAYQSLRSVATGQFVITNVCRYPEVAIKWADHLLSEEAYLRNVTGVPGVHWEWVKDPKSLGIDGKPAKWRNLTVYSVIQNASWGGIAPFWGTNMSESVEQSGDMYAAENLSWRLNAATALYDIDTVPKELYPKNLYFQPAVESEIATLRTALYDYIRESTDRFITGDLDLDKDWGTYIKQYDKIGLPRYLKIHQEAYEAWRALAK